MLHPSSKVLRIAHLTPCITDNGVSTVIRALTRALEGKGHEVEVLSWQPNSCSTDGLKIRTFAIKEPFSRPVILGKLIRKIVGPHFFNFLVSFEYCRQLQKSISLSSYDVVLIHGLSVIPFWRLREKTIVIAHNTKSKMLLSKRMPLFRPFQRIYLKKVYQNRPVISVSKGVRDDLVKAFSLSPEMIGAIYNPFDVKDIKRLSSEPICDVPEEYVLAVGRPVKAKRFDRLMRVFKESGVSCDLVVMIGHGKKKKVLNLAKKYGLEDRVYICGYRENPYPYMAQAKALALTSDYEGLPTVLIESLICGTPVVATDCPSGPSEILRDMPTCLIPVEDEKGFSAQLRAVLRSPEKFLIEELSQFSSKVASERYVRFIQKHIKGQ